MLPRHAIHDQLFATYWEKPLQVVWVRLSVSRAGLCRVLQWARRAHPLVLDLRDLFP